MWWLVLINEYYRKNMNTSGKVAEIKFCRLRGLLTSWENVGHDHGGIKTEEEEEKEDEETDWRSAGVSQSTQRISSSNCRQSSGLSERSTSSDALLAPSAHRNSAQWLPIHSEKRISLTSLTQIRLKLKPSKRSSVTEPEYYGLWPWSRTQCFLFVWKIQTKQPQFLSQTIELGTFGFKIHFNEK